MRTAPGMGLALRSLTPRPDPVRAGMADPTMSRHDQHDSPVADHYLSAGRTVRVERFEPSDSDRGTAVVLLHGADGLTYRGESYRALARELAVRGHRALLPHYFDATGTRHASLGAQPAHFLSWMQVVSDAISHATA